MLVINCEYNWDEQKTASEHWIGDGRMKRDLPTTGDVLSSKFDRYAEDSISNKNS